MSELLTIPLSQIRLSDKALREVDRQDPKFLELVQSIKQEGILNPINVRRKTSDSDACLFELIDGRHRYTGCQEAGIAEIPAQVLDRDEEGVLISQLIANAHKIETRPTDYAKQIVRILSSNPTWTIMEVAAKLNKNPAWIEKQMSLNKLVEAIKPLVDQGKMPLANAHAIALLPENEQTNFVDRACTQNPAEFVGAVNARVKEIRDANRKGNNAMPEEFVAVAHLRKKTELDEELATPKVGAELIRALEITGKCKNKDEAAIAGFRLALEWVLNIDAKRIEARKIEWAEKQKATEEARARREAEKKERRAKETTELAAKVQHEADEAKNKLQPVSA